MLDPFITMLSWPPSIDLGDETDWEAVRDGGDASEVEEPEDWED